MSRNEDIKKVGKYWIHKKHDSLVFRNNMFYWNSREEKGNSVDFLMLFYNYDFKTAIEELLKLEPEEKIMCIEKEVELNIHYSQDVRRVIAYLTKKRFIDYEIIKNLLKRELIGQDERGNIVFKIYDENDFLVGAELCGTGDKRFKGTQEGSKWGYGFNIKTRDELRYIFFFESPIDLISFYELKRDKVKNSILVSLAGLKENIFDSMIKINKMAFFNAYICVDNDLAGKQFLSSIKAKYEDVKAYLPPSSYKDWNEFLIKSKI